MSDVSEPGAPTEDRRRSRGDASRARVLEHAAAIASADGLEGLTIGRLAGEAGVAKSNIQVLFGDKQALQLATIDWVLQLVEAFNAPALAAARTPFERVRVMVDGWFAFVERRMLPGGCFMNGVSSEFRARPGPVRDRLAERRRAKRRRYVEALAAARDAGEIRPGVDVEDLAFELLSYQALANVAFAIGDDAEFQRARSISARRLDEAKAV